MINSPQLEPIAGSCAPQIMAISAQWNDLAIQLGIFCLVVGMCIGIGIGYLKFKDRS